MDPFTAYQKQAGLLHIADDLAVPAIHMLMGTHEEEPQEEHPPMPKFSAYAMYLAIQASHQVR